MIEEPDDDSCIADTLYIIAKNLQRLVRERGLTQTALAQAADIDVRTLGHLMHSGHRKHPGGSGTLANLVKLAMVLQVEPWRLLCDSPRRPF